MRPSVVDTTVLSNFAHAQRPDLLHLLFGSTIITTPTAMAELHVGEDRKLVPTCDWQWLSVHVLTSEEAEQAAQLRQQLDVGEAENLAVAISRDLTFLSDPRRPSHGFTTRYEDVRPVGIILAASQSAAEVR